MTEGVNETGDVALVTEEPAATPEPEAVVETPQLSPTEQTAREQGWVSKEEWVESGRSEDEWRPAKEFVERGELYKSIHQTKRELKQTQAALDALGKHHKMVYEKAYQQAVADLRQQRRVAIREGDFEAVDEFDEQIDQLKEQRVKEQEELQAAQTAQVGPPPEFQAFLDRNPWYMQDKGLHDEADAIGFIYLNNNGDKTQLLQHVEKEMKKRYPEKFGVKRAAPNAVAAVSRVKAAPKVAETELEESEREAMRTFVRMGVMTEEDYKKELKRAKGRS